jgi:hypothetical protein
MSLTRSLIPQQHRPILDQLLVRLSLRQGHRLALDENEIAADWGDLRDWKGRLIKFIDLEQPDEDTRCGEIADYMLAYWNAMNDMQAEEDERKSAKPGGKAA